jgi:hypothetical protein
MVKRPTASLRALQPVLDSETVAEMFGASEDEQFVAKVVPAIREFLRNLAGFFTTAQALEKAAIATLEQARQLAAPTTAAEDTAIQSFIQKANGDRKEVESHWTICQVVNGFHKRLTGARGRPTSALEEAAGIAQRLHNGYVEAERRRVAAEQERLRREAEAKAREKAALDREASMAGLSEREQLFVDYFVALNDARRAAHGALYRNADQAGSRLLNTPKIQAAIQAKRDAVAIRTQAAAKRELPLDVQVETVKPNIQKATGAVDRDYHSGEVLDEAAFIAAVIGGKHGIPWDVLTVNQTKLNEYARSLQGRLNLWPGVRHNKTTKTH